MSDEPETGDPVLSLGASGLIRTFFVFLDIPAHVEYRVADFPLMPEGASMDLSMSLKHPKDPRKTRNVDGTFVVYRRKLVYTTRRPALMGLTQYLEIGPAKKP